jgi:hypothetical protein
MTVTADTDEPGNVERISISPQPITMSNELANLAGNLREVYPSDAVIGLACRGKFHRHISRDRSDDVTRMERVLPSLSGWKFRSVDRGRAWRHSLHHRGPPGPFVG